MLGTTRGEYCRDIINPYAKETGLSLDTGEVATCELCGIEVHCHERYGLLACQHCQRTLLPGRVWT
jgi:hypothetical protein